jgi:hypothetical protein
MLFRLNSLGIRPPFLSIDCWAHAGGGNRATVAAMMIARTMCFSLTGTLRVTLASSQSVACHPIAPKEVRGRSKSPSKAS